MKKNREYVRAGIHRPSKLLVFGVMAAFTSISVIVAISAISSLIGFYWIANLAAAAMAAAWLIGYGVVSVPIQHAGVILFLGQRLKSVALLEGYNWILPEPFMRAEIVDQREQVTRIGDEKPFVITTIELTGQPNDKNQTIRLVQTKARVTITWRIEDPPTFLNIGREAVERGLVDLVVKTLRQEGSDNDDISFIRNKNVFEKKIIEGIEDEGVKKLPDGTRDESSKAVRRWGICVLGVMIPKIEYNDPEVIKAYEKVTRETQEVAAETKERNFVTESIKQLVRAGLTPQQAVLALQAERGKSRRLEIVISDGGKGDTGIGSLPSAAAVLVADKLLGGGLTGQGKD